MQLHRIYQNQTETQENDHKFKLNIRYIQVISIVMKHILLNLIESNINSSPFKF